MLFIGWKRFVEFVVCVSRLACCRWGWPVASRTPAKGDWIPPVASDWTSLGQRLEDAWRQARKENPKVGGGVVWAPLVSVDRTDGRLFAFPQGGALWVSKDRGQSFEWLNRRGPQLGL